METDSEMNCIVVDEGDDAAGGYLLVAIREQSLSANAVGLMAAKFAGPENFGTKKSGRLLYDQFWHSFDGVPEL